MTQLIPYYPYHHSDFLPEVPSGATSLTFRSGKCFLKNAGLDANLFIRAAGSITLRRSKDEDIRVELDSNYNKYRAFTTNDSLFLISSLVLDHDITSTRVCIHVPSTLKTLGLVLPRKFSFFDSEVTPFFSYVDVSSLSLVRLTTHNLFLHAARDPQIDINMRAMRAHDNDQDFAGNLSVHATGGSHIIKGTYHDGDICLTGTSTMSNEARCLGMTTNIVTTPRARNHFERIRSTRNMTYDVQGNDAAFSQENVRRAYVNMRKTLGLD